MKLFMIGLLFGLLFSGACFAALYISRWYVLAVGVIVFITLMLFQHIARAYKAYQRGEKWADKYTWLF